MVEPIESDSSTKQHNPKLTDAELTALVEYFKILIEIDKRSSVES